MGARPMLRLVQSKIKKPLAEDILFGSLVHGGDVHVTVEMRGDTIVTAVRDHGIGIPADEINLVFERFHRGRQVSSTNYGGLGLGLYITRQIVERHGGVIWVDSREGEGTTFSFSLPVADELNASSSPVTQTVAQS